MQPHLLTGKRLPWRPLLLAGAFCLCLCCGLLGASYVLADDPVLVPEALGSISGVVTDEQGVPLPGIEVAIYLKQNNSPSAARLLTTDTNGLYKAMLLGTGIYHVTARDPQHNYATTYYTNAITFDSATDVLVGGNNVTGINIKMTVAGGISGTVHFTGTAGIYSCPDCISVRIMGKVNNTWQQVTHVVPNYATSAYSVTALSVGLYRVCTYSSSGSPSSASAAEECYDNIVSGVDNAQDVAVVAGQMTPNINFLIGDDADLATLGGRVTTSNGTPLANITVRAQALSGYSSYAADTNIQGVYRITGLPVGDYVIEFRDEDGPYLGQYYNNTNRWEFADHIVLGPKTQRLDVNAGLMLGGQITGTVRLLNQTPATNAAITIWPDPAFPYPPPPFYTTLYALNGVYNSGGLWPGIYRVHADVYLPPEIHLSGYYGGINYNQAITVVVGAGEIKPNIDISLGQGVFDGSITGQVTADGVPLSGIKVALSANRYPIPPAFFYTYTDAHGQYSANGLVDGVYIVGFSDPQGIYASTYSQPVGILSGQTISNVNTSLPRAGSLSGHVSLSNGRPATDVQVNVYNQALLIYDQIPIRTQTTDANGDYKLQGLWPGTYRVCFTPTLLVVNEIQCYGAPPSNPFVQAAADIPITAGVETKHIDIALGGSAQPGRLYLPQIAR